MKMLSIEQLAKAFALGKKIHDLLILAEDLDGKIKDNIADQIEKYHKRLYEVLPDGADEDDPRLFSFVCQPPKGLWLNSSRAEISIETLNGWAAIYLDDTYSEEERSNCELLLLCYFGAQELFDVFLHQRSQLAVQKSMVKTLIRESEYNAILQKDIKLLNQTKDVALSEQKQR